MLVSRNFVTTLLLAGIMVAPAWAQTSKTEARKSAMALFGGLEGSICSEGIERGSVVHELPTSEYSSSHHLVIVAPCNNGAYAGSSVYILVDEYGRASLASFAEPHVAYTYENDDSERPLQSWRITGWKSRIEISDGYDPVSRRVTNRIKWRGIGDAFEEATYEFTQEGEEDGSFRLVAFRADPVYDRKISTIEIYDAATAR